jgi:hypothetical protein
MADAHEAGRKLGTSIEDVEYLDGAGYLRWCELTRPCDGRRGGGQPESTSAATLGRCAEFEAPAAASVSRASATSATNGRRPFGMMLEARGM